MKEKTNVVTYNGSGGGVYVSWKCNACGMVGSDWSPDKSGELVDKNCSCGG